MPIEQTPNITLNADVLRDDNAALHREWLATNGIGGYASASVAGANTRRYHGLLVASLHPPLGRAVLLSKLEETLELTARSASKPQAFPLSANLYPGTLYPQGHRTLESWTAYPVATWVWSPLPGVRFEKRIWMGPGQNTTYIAYRVLEAPEGATAVLKLTPLLAWKDYHSEMRAASGPLNVAWLGPNFTVYEEAAPLSSALRVTLPPIWKVTETAQTLDLRAVRMDGSPHIETTFDAAPNWYYRFQHPREQERGLDFEEDLYAPGLLCIPLAYGESFVLVATTEAGTVPSPEVALHALLEKQNELSQKVGLDEEFPRLLTRASDQFLVQSPGVRSTIIAGYPWFADWGRDTMIALPGLCLTTGRTELAREILLSFAQYIDQGMLPNRFPDVGEEPEYNTVDATLWYFAAIYRYVEMTGDTALLKESLWSKLQEIVRCHQQGTRYNIHVDPSDSLLYAGEPGVQLTWMDAKVGDQVITPRIGKPVEINALWVNALHVMAHFATLLDLKEDAVEYESLAKKTAESFAARFSRPDGHGLHDVLDIPSGGNDGSVRPNQVFALSLPFPAIAPDSPTAKSVIAVVQDELLTPFGLRTLSPRDPAYRPRYEGDQWHRDSAYHQGTVWPWLLGAFAEASARVTGNKAAALALLSPLQEQLGDYGLGSLAEVLDGDPPQRPNGCIAQAWSIAETLRVWKALSG